MPDIRPKRSRKPAPSTRKTERITWETIERVLASAVVDRLYLWGPPGLGKTYAAYHAKGRGSPNVYSLTCTPEQPASEIRGHYLPSGDGGFRWHDGAVVRAMREGARLVLNEISAAGDDVLSFLMPVLEHPETARFTLPTGETITPAPGLQIVVTDNCSPEALPPALRDRFDAVVHIQEPHPDALARLSEPLRTVARRGFALDDQRRTSLRGWLVLDRLRQELGLELACMVVFGVERGAHLYDAIVLAGEG